MYINIDTYILYILRMYVYYIKLYVHYIYQQVFLYWGIGANPPSSQKFAHSPRTSNNFFPHQR